MTRDEWRASVVAAKPRPSYMDAMVEFGRMDSDAKRKRKRRENRRRHPRRRGFSGVRSPLMSLATLWMFSGSETTILRFAGTATLQSIRDYCDSRATDFESREQIRRNQRGADHYRRWSRVCAEEQKRRAEVLQ